MTEQQKVGTLLIALIVMLIFTAVMTYAYFTASAEIENAGQITFGHLELNLNDFNASVDCCKNAGVIVPGCTINFNGELEVNTNIDCFVRVCFSCLVNRNADNNFTDIIFDNLQDCMKDAGWVLYSNYYYKRINTNSSNFEFERKLGLSEISLNIDKEKIGNDYQGKEISFKIEAEAIQAAHIYDNGEAPTNLTGADKNALMELSQNKAWPSNNKDSSSQDQESGKGESGKDGKADDDSESGNDGKTGEEDKDDRDSTITNEKDSIVIINDNNLVKYFIKVGGNYVNANSGQIGTDLWALINDSESQCVEIETQYCLKENWELFAPFYSIKLPQINGKSLKLTFDVDLKHKKDNLGDKELESIKNNFISDIIVTKLEMLYLGVLMCDGHLEENTITIPCEKDYVDILQGLELEQCDNYIDYAIKFKLKIEWAE